MGQLQLGLTVPEGLGLRGRLSLTVYRPDGSVRDHREGSNVMCVTGYTVIAAALVWSGLQDQAAALGITTPVYLTPLWGAVGDGSGTVAGTDTALWSELGRQTVGAGAASPASTGVAAQAAWQFYFPQPPVPWAVTEAGAFANATSAAGSGAMIDHWSFSPAVSIDVTDTVLLQCSLALGGS